MWTHKYGFSEDRSRHPQVWHAVTELLSHLVAAAHYYVHLAQARQEAIAQRLAAATTPAYPSSGSQDSAPATAPSSPRLAGSERVASIKRRLGATLTTAARPSLAGHTPSGGAARTPLSSGRRPSVAGGRKSMVSKFPISCDEEDKENSPALGKLVTASLGNVQTPITAQAPHRSSLAPMAGGVDPNPCMTPHALQFRVVAVPFWGLQAGAPEASATEEVLIAAATTTAGPLLTGPPTPSGPTPAVAGDLTAAAAGLLSSLNDSQGTMMSRPADAELVASVNMVPNQAPSPAALSGKRAGQGQPSMTVPTAAVAVAARRQSPPCASSRAYSKGQVSTGRQSAGSQAGSTIAAAKQIRLRGSKVRTASAAAPAASQMVTRSQAAARKHVERMQARSRQCKHIL